MTNRIKKRRINALSAIRMSLALGVVASLSVLGVDTVLTRGFLHPENTGQRTIYHAVAAGITMFGAGLVAWRYLLGQTSELFEDETTNRSASESDPAPSNGNGPRLDHLSPIDDQTAQVLTGQDAKTLFPGVIGESRIMRAVLAYVLKVAPSEATVLLTGESGTGKDLFANTIHEHSKRKDKPFLAVNCAAIPPGLMESELFGHEKGAFTGAINTKKGKFEQASGGTLFLDEIGDMPLETQAKILRALENGEAERVGGATPVRFNVRLVAATNKNLSEMIEAGTFREDLFHRLNVFPLTLPPLRVRPEDIPALARHFLDRFGQGLTLSAEAMGMLMAHTWPGNVRELRNTLERATVLAGNAGEVRPEHLPAQLRLSAPGQAAGMQTARERDRLAREGGQPVIPGALSLADPRMSEDHPMQLDEHLAETEKKCIIAALVRTRGIQVRAARLLGIKERSLWHRVKKFGLNPEEYKQS
ncbi:hypothetical protein JCM15519_34520 [Fundidesulfovibrio butyratiphilus]